MKTKTDKELIETFKLIRSICEDGGPSDSKKIDDIHKIVDTIIYNETGK